MAGDEAAAVSEVPSDDGADAVESAGPDGSRASESSVTATLVAGLVVVLMLAGLGAWFAHQSWRDYRADHQRSLFLQVAEQGALNLTTIDFNSVEGDVARILNSSTGQFYDEFQARAPQFVDFVKSAQSKSSGKVVEAGIESEDGGQASVVIRLAVTTSAGSVSEDAPRQWRMRITVQRVNDGAKVSNVEFVP